MRYPDIRIVHIMKVKGVSGAENHLLTLLSELVKNYRIFLILLVEPGNFMDDFVRDFQKRGINVTRIIISHHYDISMLWKIYYLIRKIKPHIVHTHMFHADFYGGLAAGLAGVKVILSTKHGYDDYERTSKFYKLNRLPAKFLTRAITISNALKSKVAEAEGLSFTKMVTIHYGLNGEEYVSTKELNSNMEFFHDDVCHIATVGRLIPVKGYEFLIKALSEVKSDFRFLFIGEGPLREELERMTRELHLTQKVIFLGYQRDVSSILSKIDIFILPTLGEGFGLVLLEAMAH